MPSPKTSKNVVSKQPKKTETRKKLVAPVLEYDLVEDLKKLRENILVFELLKFLLILQKMLQRIVGNSKKNDVISKKLAEIDLNKAKYVPSKNSLEN